MSFNIRKLMFISMFNFFVYQLLFGQISLKFDEISHRGLEINQKHSIGLLIEQLPPQAEKIGLLPDNLMAIFEKHFKTGGLKIVPEQEEYLYLNLSLTNRAFNISLSFDRPVYFIANDKVYITTASTWEHGAIGTHLGEAKPVLDSLDKLLKIFLETFLSANQK